MSAGRTNVASGGGGGSVELVTVQLEAFRQTTTLAYTDGESLKEASSSPAGAVEIQVMKNSIMIIIDGSTTIDTSGEIDDISGTGGTEGLFVYGNGWVSSY